MPIWPVSAGRKLMARILEPPLESRLTCMPIWMMEVSASAYMRAKLCSSSTVQPQVSATRSAGHSSAAFFSSSRPMQCFSTYSLSYRSSSSSTFATPRANGVSVPGRILIHSSAHSHNGMRNGLMTAIFPPFSTHCFTNLTACTDVAEMLLPHET